MKITMLGTSRSGKTTYLAAMLGLLYDAAVERFNLRPFESTDVDLCNEIDRINSLYTRGEFPISTEDDIRKLSLSLYKENEKLVDFDFVDYRGGALMEIAKNENSEHTEALSTAIMVSDVVLVFVDAILLKASKFDPVARERLGVRPITTVLMRARQSLQGCGKKLNIMFVLTKTDASTISQVDIPELKNRIPSIYSTIYSQFGDDSANFFIIDTAAVGRGKVRTKLQKIQATEEEAARIEGINIITARDLDYEPINIVSVLAQAFLMGIDTMSYNVEKLSELLEQKRVKGFLNNLLDILIGSPKRKTAKRIEYELQESREQLLTLSKHKSALSSIVSSRR